jgi:4-hydroxybenzoate polyprenyltransferase
MALMLDGPAKTSSYMRFIGYVRLYRLSIVAPISVAFLLGTTDTSVVRPSTVEVLWLLGILYHAYGCGLNDLADAEIDRGNPSRRSSPLPGELLSRQEALLATNLAGIGFLVLPVLAHYPVRVFYGCAVLAAIQTWGNLFQKRSRWVPTAAVDWMFIPAAGGPVLLGAWATGTRVGYAVITLGFAFGMQMILFNVLAGNLKDIEYDASVGSKTTALALGVRADGRLLRIPRRYVYYVALLEVLSVAALVAAAPVPTGVWGALCCVLAVIAVAAGVLDLRRVLVTRASAAKGRQFAIIFNWVALMAIVAAREPLVAGISLLSTLLWVPGIRWLETRPVGGSLAKAERSVSAGSRDPVAQVAKRQQSEDVG